MKKIKGRILAWILAAAMVITVFPAETVHAATIDQSNDYMRFYTPDSSNEQQIDIQGKFNGSWLQTTYSNAGYAVVREGLDNATLTVTPAFIYGGRFVELTYKVTATGGAVTGGKLGLHADVQIGSNDYATVTLIKEGSKGIGFQMIDEGGTGACFQFYFAGSALKSSNAASTYWMGNYGERQSNVYTQTGSSEIKGIDSGIALSWQNINLAQGASAEYKVMLGIGTQKDLQDALGGGTDYDKEAIRDLEPGNYKIIITSNGETYYFNNVTQKDGIPFAGTDSNGKIYDFTGKELSIVKIKDNGQESEPSDIIVAPRPEKPDEIDVSKVDTNTENGTVTIGQANTDQEYILVPEGTEITDDLWENAKKASDSNVTFDRDSKNQPLDTSKKYVIYTRKYATSEAPKSDAQGPSDVIIFHHHSWNYTVSGSAITLECISTEKPCQYHTDKLTVALNVAGKMEYSGAYYSGAVVTATYAGESTVLTDGRFPVTGDAISEITYYTDADCTTRTTPEQNGSAYIGGAPKNTGEYWVAIQAAGKAVRNSFEIEKKSLSQAVVTLRPDTCEATGSDIVQEIQQVEVDGRVLDASDYEIDPSSVMSAKKYGTYTIKLNGVGNYKDSVTASWRILDVKAPVGRMAIANKTWTTLLNDITFHHFFKNTQTVTITADDGECGSGVAEIAYLVTENACTTQEKLENADWQIGDTFEINPRKNIYLYARLKDQAGNISYISSEGIVLYEDSVVKTEKVTYVKTTQEDKEIRIARNGNTIKKVVNTTTGYILVPGTDYEENETGIILKASYMQELKPSANAYLLTVSYNPGGREYVDEAGNEKPMESRIELIVKKAEGRITDVRDLTKTYDGIAVEAPAYTKIAGDDVTVEYRQKDAGEDTYTTVAPKAAGAYVVRISAKADEDYTAAEAERDFTIYQRPITVSGIQASDKTYDGTRKADLKMSEVQLNGMLEGDVLAIEAVGAFENKDAAADKRVEIRELKLTGDDCGNYRLAAKGQQTETQATITRKEVTVTADTVKKHIDMEDPVLTYKADGLIAGETLAGVYVVRQDGEEPGTYDIQVQVEENANPNYAITTVNGTFTIEDHDWSGDWIVTKEATAAENGRREKVCQVAGCGHMIMEVIPKVGTTDDGPIGKRVEVTPDSPVKEGSLDTKKSELLDSDKIFTKEEKELIKAGVDARVWLEFAKTNESLLTDVEKTELAKAAKDLQGDDLKMVFFDVNLFKQIAGSAKTQIFEAGMPLKVTIKLPDELINRDNHLVREYKLLRLHDGKVDTLEAVYNETTGEVTFETDRFSTFAIIYKDVARTEAQSTIAPKTGDTNHPMLMLLLFSIGMLGCAATFRKRWSI